jgi:predicted nuclease of predicted toxin-antitoxin system
VTGLLLDNGLPRSAVPLLSAAGITAVHVGDIGMAHAADETILRHATANQQWVVTLDADFHTLLALSGDRGPSVIRVRIEGMKGPELAQIILRVVRQFNAELTAGAAVSVGPKVARCHLLPLG